MPRRTLYSLLGVPPKPVASSSTTNLQAGKPAETTTPSNPTFDREHKYVTSPVFRNPFIFGGLRLVVGVYSLGVIIYKLVDEVRQGDGDE